MFPLDFVSLETLLPLFLVVAIVYGALEVSGVFKNRAVKGIIAVVFGFFAVMNAQVVSLINYILPYAAAFFVVIFLIWIVLKPLRGKSGGKGIDPVIVIVVLVLALVLLARLNTMDYIPEYSFLANPNLIWGIGIAIVIYIIYKAYKMGSGGGAAAVKQ